MDIVFSADNNKEVYVIPIVTPPINIDQPSKNQVFETINQGEINLPGQRGLTKISWNSFFPNRRYPFIKKGALYNGWLYVDFFNRWRDKKVPLRIVITNKYGVEVLNLPVLIDSFTTDIDKVGDIVYSIALSEYKLLSGV